MFLNLILHHKCRHQQVPIYYCTLYIVFVRVSVNLVNKFLLTFLHRFFRQIKTGILSGTFKCVPIANLNVNKYHGISIHCILN